MSDGEEYTREEIEAIRDILHRAWFAIQDHHARLGGDTYSLTTGDLRVMKLIADRPDTILRDIRDELGIPHSTLTGVIDRLERNGLVRRVMTDRDRRSYGVVLTAKGRSFQDAHGRADDELAARVLGVLSDRKERRWFIDTLDRITKELG